MENGKEKIRILKNGPYVVTGRVPLYIERIVPDGDGNGESYAKGKEYETADCYSLCRCGHAKTRPFCDGTHKEVEFSAPETACRACYCEAARVYEGGTIDLLDAPELCARARFCDRFENAWRLTLKSSEAHPEYEERAVYEANHCPGGRITVRKDGVEIEPCLPKEIGLLEDVYYGTRGPIFVKGGITLTDEDDAEYETRNRRALCRCGGTRNMPFCDGAHLRKKHMKGSDE
ncbi:MAG: CDGSH iron-sulfur domain-containing protein [Clostridiales Family XIII bacterium]|jgi:CDGSH-type Zn-finger protein|nr:CDGSH iron-sulfur domain-containing protein [Clostridiales Family XIII bacterium]